MSKTIDPNKVAIYIRWSTEDQSSGTTLQIQLEGCKHYILSQGWNINESLIFIDDGYSGGNLNRPGITKLRKLVQEKLIDCIVVFKLDRLSRSVIDTVNLVLKEWEDKTFLKSAREPLDTITPMGKQFFYILVSFAEFERNIIKERTLSGKFQRAKEGKNSGFKYPYGYKKGTINNSFEIIPEEAAIIKRIFNEYLNGKGTAKIAIDLNEQGIKFRNNKIWAKNNIVYILQNKIYAGILEYGRLTRNNSKKSYKKNQNYISIKSSYIKPIIDLETFLKIQEFRKTKNVKKSGISGRTIASEHLLTGILKCKCGYSRYGINKRKNRNITYYGCIGNHQKGKSFCNTGLINKEWLDNTIIELIKTKFLNQEQFNKMIKNYIEKINNQLNELRLNIKTMENSVKLLDNQLTKLDQDYRNQLINAQTYNRLYNQIEAEKNTANIQLLNLTNEYKQINANEINMEEIKKIPTVLEQWDYLSITEKKMFLYKLIDHITVYKQSGKKNNHVDIEIIYKI